jgi:hypothetical protein
MSTVDLGKVKDKLSVAERVAVEQQIADQEEQLANPEGLQASGQNGVAEMKADIAKKKEMLDRDSSLVAVGSEKDRIVARIKELQDAFLPDMPTKNEMWAKGGTEESDRAVQKNMRFHRLHDTKLFEWQNLKKRLEPHDPWAQSLDSIRPEK